MKLYVQCARCKAFAEAPFYSYKTGPDGALCAGCAPLVDAAVRRAINQ